MSIALVHGECSKRTDQCKNLNDNTKNKIFFEFNRSVILIRMLPSNLFHENVSQGKYENEFLPRLRV